MAYEKIGNFSCFYRIGVTWPLVFVYKARVAVKLSGFVVCGERGECIRELGREEERVGRREGHELGLGQVPPASGQLDTGTTYCHNNNNYSHYYYLHS